MFFTYYISGQIYPWTFPIYIYNNIEIKKNSSKPSQRPENKQRSLRQENTLQNNFRPNFGKESVGINKNSYCN